MLFRSSRGLQDEKRRQPEEDGKPEREPGAPCRYIALDRQNDPVDACHQPDREENRQDAGLGPTALASRQQRGRPEVQGSDDEQRHRVEPQSLVGL